MLFGQALYLALGDAGNETDGPEAPPRILDEHHFAETLPIGAEHRIGDLLEQTENTFYQGDTAHYPFGQMQQRTAKVVGDQHPDQQDHQQGGQ